ncbi:MAG: hypothetical protein WCR06_09575 [bacterium]
MKLLLYAASCRAPVRTLTAELCLQAADMFAREGLAEEAQASRSAGEDIHQAYSLWHAEQGLALPDNVNALTIACVMRRTGSEPAPVFYTFHPLYASILLHDAFRYLQNPGFVLDHEHVHCREFGLTDELAVCRRHLAEIPPRGRDILNQCAAAQQRQQRLTLRALAVSCGMDPATLNYYRRHPRVDRAVMDVLPLTTRDRLTAALASVEQEALRNHLIVEQKQVAVKAGLDEATLIACKRRHDDFACRLDEAIARSVAHYRGAMSRRIADILQAYEKESSVFNPADLARRAGMTVAALKEAASWDADLAGRIDDCFAGSLCRALERAMAEANRDGVEVTQAYLAGQLDVSEASISAYKKLPVVGDLIRNGLAFSAVEKVRQAVESLASEGVPVTLGTVAGRAGVDPSTVSRIRARDEELRGRIGASVNESTIAARFPDVASVHRRLQERRALYGRDDCNTASALSCSLENGGDSGLLRACHQLHVPLPQARPEAANWLVVYLNRMSETKLLTRDEAQILWQRGRADDPEAAEELMVRTRPLVRFIIESDLREEIDPSGVKSDLLEHLIRRGDDLLLDAFHAPEIEGHILGHFQRALAVGLRRARIDYYLERSTRYRRTLSLDQPLGADGDVDTYTLLQTRSLASQNLSPDEVVSVLDGSSVEHEMELVARRDEASGVHMVRSQDKQALAATLGQILTRAGAHVLQSRGVVGRWALFLGGSLGRLGTAVYGKCGLELYLLVDGTDLFAVEVATYLGDLARTNPQVRVLLQRFGVAALAPARALAIRKALVNGHDRSFSSGLTPEEFLFQIQANGILVLESARTEARSLAAAFIRSFADETPEDVARGILDAKVDFLAGQREALHVVALEMGFQPR